MTDAPDPTRRQLLRMGGLSVALGSVLAACSDDDPAPSGTPEGQSSTTDPDPVVSDVALLNTVLSVEVLAFDTYQLAIDGGLLERGEVAEALALFQQHHAEHRAALVAVVESSGDEPFDTANPVAKVVLVDPALAAVTAERDLVRILRDLEQVGARLAVHAASVLREPDQRTTIMAIGAVASRRATFLDRLGELSNEQLARFPTSNPLPADAVVPD